jgi:hypothetical protein
MANIITAGNSTNGGTAITTDTSGTLNIVTGSGSGVTALSIDASGNVSGVLKSGTAVASTSGTSIDFTGIPSTAKRITVMFNGVSTNGTSNTMVQIGSTTFTTTGYLGSAGVYQNLSTAGVVAFTTGFGVLSSTGAGTVFHGLLTINLITGNSWVASGNFASSNAAVTATSAGFVALSGVLDRVRITTVNGTDAFDAGTINIFYE